MIKVFMVIMACHAPQFTECTWLDSIEYGAEDLYRCQLDRIVNSGMWRYEIQTMQGHDDWSVFSMCDLVDDRRNGT